MNATTKAKIKDATLARQYPLLARSGVAFTKLSFILRALLDSVSTEILDLTPLHSLLVINPRWLKISLKCTLNPLSEIYA